MEKHNSLFQLVLVDPPWSLGIKLNYKTLKDHLIFRIPFRKLQADGFIAIWVIEQKVTKVIKVIENLGNKHCGKLLWIKTTLKGNLVNGNGKYTRHSDEDLHLFRIGKVACITHFCKALGVVLAERTKMSEKPESIPLELTKLIPNGYYQEIFARYINIRPGFFLVGNQLKQPPPSQTFI
jgi:N6-adenosine-specific RNA methylase IME4